MPSCLEFRRVVRSEEHTSELQSHSHLVCRLLLEKTERRLAVRTDQFHPGAAAEAVQPHRGGYRRVVLDRRHCDLFFNDTATTEIYTLSLHDALPISVV